MIPDLFVEIPAEDLKATTADPAKEAAMILGIEWRELRRRKEAIVDIYFYKTRKGFNYGALEFPIIGDIHEAGNCQSLSPLFSHCSAIHILFF